MSVEYSTTIYYGCKCDEYYSEIWNIIDSLPDSQKEDIEGLAEEYVFCLNSWSGEGEFLGEDVQYLGDVGDCYSLKETLAAKDKYIPSEYFLKFETFLRERIPDLPPFDFYIVNQIH